nr:Lipoxygenasey domain-containing protein [Ipomoea batatas]
MVELSCSGDNLAERSLLKTRKRDCFGVSLITCLPGVYCSDFQDYVKPSRLLPATEVESCQDSSLEKVITSFNDKTFECLYIVKLRTSSVYGSDLSDVNSGVLLCLIDENGDSILRRISPGLMNYYNSNAHHFQRGSVDEFIFEGPELGKITAVWIGLESGALVYGNCKVPKQISSRCSTLHSVHLYLVFLNFRFSVQLYIEDTLLGENSDSKGLGSVKKGQSTVFPSSTWSQKKKGGDIDDQNLRGLKGFSVKLILAFAIYCLCCKKLFLESCWGVDTNGVLFGTIGFLMG